MGKILLINQGKSDNLGDKAIKETAIKLLTELGHEVEFAGYAQCKEQNINEILTNNSSNFSIKLKNRMPSIIKWLLKYHWEILKEFKEKKEKKYECIVIGGGQLLKKNSVFPFCLLTWIYLLRKNKQKNIFLVGVGIDQNENYFEKNIYKILFKKIKGIYVRDEDSREYLKKNYNINSQYIPDLVFSHSRYIKNQENQNKNYLTIMIFDFVTLTHHFGKKITREEYYNQWVELIRKNIQDNLEIVLTYTTIEDKIETDLFKKYLDETLEVKTKIKEVNTLEDLERVLQKSKIVISGRMHGLILAYNYECKLIPYIVSQKLESFNNNYLLKDKTKNEMEKDILTSLKNIFKEIDNSERRN